MGLSKSFCIMESWCKSLSSPKAETPTEGSMVTFPISEPGRKATVLALKDLAVGTFGVHDISCSPQQILLVYPRYAECQPCDRWPVERPGGVRSRGNPIYVERPVGNIVILRINFRFTAFVSYNRFLRLAVFRREPRTWS